MVSKQDAALLRNSRLFAGIDELGLAHLAERASRRSFGRGETIFREGDAGDTLYVIAEGGVKVWVSSGDGSEMVLATLRSPDAFGELSAVDGEGRSASATALEPTVLVSLDRDDVARCRPSPRRRRRRHAAGTGGLARRITEQASDLVFLDLAGRVAKTLATLADRDGRVDGDAIVLPLPLTQTELAEMVGGSRQSVNQILKSFEARGYLALQGREARILNPEALRLRGAR